MCRGISEAAVCTALLLVAFGASQAGQPAGGETAQAEELARMWRDVQIAEVDSPEFLRAGRQLFDLIKQVPRASRVAAAAAMMGRYAPENINAAVVELFGPDPFPIEQIRAIVFDQSRTRQQRVLVRTYFGICRGKYNYCPLSDNVRLQLLGVLTDRLKSLTGEKVTYGEQRLLTHFCGSLVSRYGDQVDQVPQARWVVQAMGAYAAAAPAEDSFAASARGWLKLLTSPPAAMSSPEVAVDLLGHWDPLARLEAAHFLGRRMSRDSDVVQQVWQVLADRRDAVRAAGLMAFSVATDVRPDDSVDKFVEMLTRDRGVVVQAAASVALGSRGRRAARAIGPLIDSFKPPKGRPRPGAKRTGSILSALANLVPQADSAQRETMLSLATEKLSAAPAGALELLKALGPEAKSALPQIEKYRRTADRYRRRYIDRHVMPAIAYGSVDPDQESALPMRQ